MSKIIKHIKKLMTHSIDPEEFKLLCRKINLRKNSSGNYGYSVSGNTSDAIIIQGNDNTINFSNMEIDPYEFYKTVNQPTLEIPFLEYSFHNRFYFASCRVEFIGRKKHFKYINDFIDNKKRLLWCLLTGDAGSGKSRFALEICKKYKSKYFIGFLSEVSSFDWLNWEPNFNTFIIIDYASTKDIEINRMLIDLSKNVKLSTHKVRILLIERNLKGKWLNNLIGYGSSKYITNNIIYDNDSTLKLENIDRHEILSIIKNHSINLSSNNSFIDELIDSKIDKHPLFIMFAVEAWEKHRDINKWDKEKLLNDVIQREIEIIWKPRGINEKYLNLLALTTMLGQIKLVDIYNNKRLDLYKDIIPDKEEFCSDLFEVMTGKDSKEFLHGLEPDILGEHFVLNQLSQNNSLDIKRYALSESAWKLQQFSYKEFLFRTYQNFPEHPTIKLLLNMPEYDLPCIQAEWASLLVNTIKKNIDFQSSQRAEEFYKLLSSIYDNYTEKALYKINLSFACFFLVNGFINSSNKSKFLEYYEDLNRIELNDTDGISYDNNIEVYFNPYIQYKNIIDMDYSRVEWDKLLTLVKQDKNIFVMMGEESHSYYNNEIIRNIFLKYRLSIIKVISGCRVFIKLVDDNDIEYAFKVLDCIINEININNGNEEALNILGFQNLYINYYLSLANACISSLPLFHVKEDKENCNKLLSLINISSEKIIKYLPITMNDIIGSDIPKKYLCRIHNVDISVIETVKFSNNYILLNKKHKYIESYLKSLSIFGCRIHCKLSNLMNKYSKFESSLSIKNKITNKHIHCGQNIFSTAKVLLSLDKKEDAIHLLNILTNSNIEDLKVSSAKLLKEID